MILDISVSLQNVMPVWPDSCGMRLFRTSMMESGDQCNISRLDCDVHIGTHIDAPYHFIIAGSTIDKIPLEMLVGPAIVVHFPEVQVITVASLENLILPEKVSRILFKTRNSDLWEKGITEFRNDYVALTSDAASWLADKGFCLVGIDYLSIQRYGDDSTTHRILLEKGIIILEGLNLSNIEPGTYELICMPLKLVGADGAPARAALMDNRYESRIYKETL
jgi:arylformamidase